jgi:hypothetical protein
VEVRTIQDITFGVTGQSVYFDAPEGRPTSVTSCEVFTWDVGDDDTVEAAVGTPAVETNPNTTLDASASEGAESIPLLATTGIVADRRYLITSAAGIKESVEVESVTSGISVTIKHPLHNAFASLDTFQSTRITAAIDASWIADDTNLTTDDVGPNPMFRVRWVYVVAGTTYAADSYFNVVRYAGRHGVQPQDIEVMLPGWMDTLPTDHRNTQGRSLIDDAYRSVKLDLRKIDLAASGIAESEVVDELVRYKVIALGERVKLLSGGGDAQAVQMAKMDYQEQLDALLRVVSRVPVRDGSGAATPSLSVGFTKR